MRSSEYRSFLGWLDNPDSLQYWSQPHLQCGRVCRHQPAYTSCRNWESTDLLIPSDSPGLIGPMLNPPFKYSRKSIYEEIYIKKITDHLILCQTSAVGLFC